MWRHEIGASASTDALVFEEPDEHYFVGIGVSRDDRWVVITAASKTTSEVRLLDAATPLAQPRVVAERRPGVEYDVEPAGDRLLIVHNAGDPDFEVAQAPITSTGPQDWTPFMPAVAGERVVAVEAFAGFVAVSLRRDGLTAVRVLRRDANAANGFAAPVDLAFDEPIYSIATGNTPDDASPTLQVVFESMVTPSTVYDYDVASGKLTLLKRKAVQGDYDLTQPCSTESGRWHRTAPGCRSRWCTGIGHGRRHGSGPALRLRRLRGEHGPLLLRRPALAARPRRRVCRRARPRAAARWAAGGTRRASWTTRRNTFTDFVAAPSTWSSRAGCPGSAGGRGRSAPAGC